MPELGIDTALEWRGRPVVDRDGGKIGTLREIYLDESERPSWASVDTGLFGLRQSLLPLADARLVNDEVQVPYEREHVKAAPNVDPEVQLSPDEEDRLYGHYGRASTSEPDQAQALPVTDPPDARGTTPSDEPGAVTASENTPAPEDATPSDGQEAVAASADSCKEAEGARQGDTTTPSTEHEMIRSEEQLVIGKRVRERKARLRKYVVTDYVETKVPVQREEVRIEYEPDEENESGQGADGGGR
jgi:stress response protein YsnF